MVMAKQVITCLLIILIGTLNCRAFIRNDTILLCTHNDSLSYALGKSNDINGLNSYVKSQVKLDSINTFHFQRGFKDYIDSVDEKGFEAYYSGIMTAKMIIEQVKANVKSEFGCDTILNDQIFYKGLIDLLTNDDHIMADSIANKIFAESQNDYASRKELLLTKEAENFLKNNKREGIVELPSGLQYKIIKKGKGQNITLSDQIFIEYKCKNKIGNVIEDSRVHSPSGVVLDMANTFAGLQEGLSLMKKGAEFEFFIPHYLLDTYHKSDFPVIVYEVKILDVKQKK